MLTSRGRLETPTIRVPPYVRFYADGTRGPIQDTRPRVVPWTMTSDGEVRVRIFLYFLLNVISYIDN